MADIEARLLSHARSFDATLALIPSKDLFHEGQPDGRRRRKQSKAEARAAKRAKLDPQNAKSAKDTLDERVAKGRAAKRKLASSDANIPASDQPDNNIDTPSETSLPAAKKAKLSSPPKHSMQHHEAQSSTPKRSVAEKHQAKRQRQKDRRDALAARKAARNLRKEEHEVQQTSSDGPPNPSTLPASAATTTIVTTNQPNPTKALTANPPTTNLTLQPVQPAIPPSPSDDSSHASTTPASSNPPSPTFDTSNQASGTSSISSIVNPSADQKSVIPPVIEQDRSQTQPALAPAREPRLTPDEQRARLRKRIEELRQARKAVKEDGTPVRTRQELIDSRRQKQEKRKATKKLLHQQAKEEAERARQLALSRGSPLMSPSVGSSLYAQSPLGAGSTATRMNGSGIALAIATGTSDDPVDTSNLSFGRVAFDDGQIATADLSTLIDPSRHAKGPSDPRTALRAAQNRAARNASLDEATRADLAEKDVWLRARKHAHGERVRDDPTLLAKALKRQTQSKRKSEREWGERVDGVRRSQDARQTRREANLAARRDAKGSKRAGKPGAKKGPGSKGARPSHGKGADHSGKTGKAVSGKRPARPGFEGSFRAGAPRKI